MLDIQHLDASKVKLEPTPFLFVCRFTACIPSNVDMKSIKDELQKQGVTIDEFFLRLKSTSKDVGWDLRDMCTALTIWRRNRSSNEFDVQLYLVPHSTPNTEDVSDREEIILPTPAKVFTQPTTFPTSHSREFETSQTPTKKPEPTRGAKRRLQRKVSSRPKIRSDVERESVTRRQSKDIHVDKDRDPKRIRTTLPPPQSEEESLPMSHIQLIYLREDNHDVDVEIKYEREELSPGIDDDLQMELQYADMKREVEMEAEMESNHPATW